MATVLSDIGSYAAALRYEDLPLDVVQYTKSIVLDSVGCLYGGLGSDPARLVADVAAELGGRPQATVVSAGTKTSMELAALVNGVALRYLDFNDTYFGPAWTAHASDNIATLLAVAEAVGASGRELIRSVVLAYEVQMAFSDLPVVRNLWHEGWHHSAACAYSAAAGVAALLGLDAQAMAHAMALSGARANTFSEIRHGDIPMDKALSAPLVASRAVTSALLARRGFTGQLTLLEGDYGFKHAVARGADVSALIPHRGDGFRILKSALKPYPVEGMTPAMVQAALELREGLAGRRLEDISEITIHVHEEALTKPSWDPSKLAPTSKETADHSFTFCVALALVAGDVTIDHFTEKWLSDARVLGLMRLTQLREDPELTAAFRGGQRPAAVELRFGDERLYRRVMYPKGSPENPMSDEEIRVKFDRLAAPYLTREQRNVVWTTVRSLEDVDDVAPFVASLAERGSQECAGSGFNRDGSARWARR